MIRSMVSHDFARGTIRGLPPSVVGAARKTGKLPEGAISALMVDSWNAVRAQQKNAFVGLTVADVQRMRWGFETEEERREAWEVFAGKGGPAPRRVPIESWKCACKPEGSANGTPCGWNLEGVIEDAGPWTYDATHDWCEAKGRCTLSSPCGCYDAGRSAEISVKDPDVAAEVAAACGMDGEHKPSCAEVKCEPFHGKCACRVRCVAKGQSCESGSWRALRERDYCPASDDTAADATIRAPACAKPNWAAIADSLEEAQESLQNSLRAHGALTSASPAERKCDPIAIWRNDIEPGGGNEYLADGCVDNARGPTSVLIWCCNHVGTYVLPAGQSTCTEDTSQSVDIDNVQDLSGQWWKLEDGVRAEVQPDGTVTFAKRDGVIIGDGFAIDACGEE